MQKLLILLALSFFSSQGLAASCPDGNEPTKTVSDDGSYFVYKCGLSVLDAPKAEFYQRQYDMDSEVDQILSQRKTINPFLAWNDEKANNGNYYGIRWTGSKANSLLQSNRFEFDESHWNYYYVGKPWGYWRDHAKQQTFVTNIDWKHDAEYGVTKAMNIVDPRFPKAFAEQVSFASVKGIHGLLLDWWNLNFSSPYPKNTQQSVMIRITDEIRKQLGDDFLILGNTNDNKNQNLVSSLNGVFSELWKSHQGSFTFEEIAEMEELIKFNEKHLRYPKLITFNAWRITDKSDPYNRTSEDNLRFARLYSAMATVIPEHGYILYGDNNTDFDDGDHDHHYYDFYSVDLGKPVSKYTPIAQGVAYKKFEYGYIAFNRLEYDVTVNFGDFEVVIPSMDAVFLNEDGTKNICNKKDFFIIDSICVNSGQKTYWHENGKISLEENYKDGKKEGMSTSWYKNGQIKSEVNYKYHNREGKELIWYQSGEIKSENNYKNDMRDGVFTSWYKSGQIKSGNNYKNGNKEGKFTTWYQSGEIKSEINYKNNFREGKGTSWYVNGQKNTETIYKNGNKEGKSSAWHDNGQIKLEESYIDDKREGIRTSWYINGQKMYEDNFKNGKLDGKKTNWHENGQIKSEDNYQDGIRI